MPPPYGIRITIGSSTRPRVRLRILATCETTCSNAGYPNASNCISTTGRIPFIAIPTAIPTMPASANGVSKQRFSPNSAVSPSVIRNTPPSAPTSSPNITTVSSACIASRSAWLSAWAIEIFVCVMASGLLSRQLVTQERRLLAELLGLLGVQVLEQIRRVHLRLGHRAVAQPRGHVARSRLRALPGLVVQPTLPLEVRRQPLDRIAVQPRRDL